MDRVNRWRMERPSPVPVQVRRPGARGRGDRLPEGLVELPLELPQAGVVHPDPEQAVQEGQGVVRPPERDPARGEREHGVRLRRVPAGGVPRPSPAPPPPPPPRPDVLCGRTNGEVILKYYK